MALNKLQPELRVQVRGEGVCITENILKLQSCLKDSLNTQGQHESKYPSLLALGMGAVSRGQGSSSRAFPAPNPWKIHPWGEMKGVWS